MEGYGQFSHKELDMTELKQFSMHAQCLMTTRSTKESARLWGTDIGGRCLQQVSPHAAPHPTHTAVIYSLGCTHWYSQYRTCSLWPGS